MTESTSAPVSAVQPAATNSPKKQQKNQQKANQVMVHHIQNIRI
jgi:hypothetical protein